MERRAPHRDEKHGLHSAVLRAARKKIHRLLMMGLTPTQNEWLPWLNRVRFLIITLLVIVVVAVQQMTSIQVPAHMLVPLVVLWYTLAVVYLVFHRWMPQARWQAPLQMTLDIAIISGVVYATGAQDSNFISLYLLAILLGSILFRAAAPSWWPAAVSCCWRLLWNFPTTE